MFKSKNQKKEICIVKEFWNKTYFFWGHFFTKIAQNMFKLCGWNGAFTIFVKNLKSLEGWSMENDNKKNSKTHANEVKESQILVVTDEIIVKGVA